MTATTVRGVRIAQGRLTRRAYAPEEIGKEFANYVRLLTRVLVAPGAIAPNSGASSIGYVYWQSNRQEGNMAEPVQLVFLVGAGAVIGAIVGLILK